MLKKEQIKELVKEVREDFQIPPFFSDEALGRYAAEGEQEFRLRVEDAEFINDYVARSLLKNYMNYAYFKKLDDYFVNYEPNIMTWEISKLGKAHEKTTASI